MSPTRVRLIVNGPVQWLLLGLGAALSGWFCVYLASVALPPDRPGWERAVAWLFVALVALPWVRLLATVRSRLRWLEVDGRGLRLLRGSGAVLTDLPWEDLAGVGVMVDEAAARHEMRAKSWLTRSTVRRVPPWLELVPASEAAVRRHPELPEPIPAGDGRPARWMVRLSEGWARRPDVGPAVERWRPDLWWGVRDGSTPRAALHAPVGVSRTVVLQREPMARQQARTGGPRTPPPAPAPAAAAGPARSVPVPPHPRGRVVWAVIGIAAVVTAALLWPAARATAAAGDPPSGAASGASLSTIVAVLVLAHLLRRNRRTGRLVADADALRLYRGGDDRPVWEVAWPRVTAARVERRGAGTSLYVRPGRPDLAEAHPELAAVERRVRLGSTRGPCAS